MDTETLKKFNRYLIEQNKLFNLTAIKDETASWQLNILDSLLFLDAIPHGASVCDVGSGSGCPAIPIAIERPDIEMTMADSTKKKIDFLNSCVLLLNLKNAKAVHTRIEDIKVRDFNIVTARAVAPLNTLLEYCIPLLKVGGALLAFKGANYQTEIDEAKNAFKLLDCKLENVLTAALEPKANEQPITRYCLIIRKLAPTNSKYPRAKNLPRLKPL
jgi:16S rRNA (guanine527-N7)-methyltransferase